MPKKTWGIILVCFLALFLVSPKAEAADSGACGEHLSWTLDDAGTLTISGTGDMYDFTYDTQPWKSAQFNTVTIESGVTSIGSHAFDSCRALTRAVIPHSVSRIGNYGFLFCNALRDVTIPNSVISIGTQAFGDCNELTSINIPEGVVEIGTWAFSGCAKLSNVTISSSVTSIGGAAFTGCASLTKIDVDKGNTAYTSVNGVLFNKNQTTLLAFPGAYSGSYTIPNTVTTINREVFNGCKNLTEIIIPDGVQKIDDWAFQSCESLTSVNIPASVTNCSGGVFAHCYSLKTIRVDEKNPAYVSVDGGLFSKDRTILLDYPCGNDKAAYIIPKSVTEIKVAAFKGCKNLKKVTILNGVTDIGYEAFCSCQDLATVVIPGSVAKVSTRVFAECRNLKDVYYGGTSEQWDAIEGVKDLLPQNVAFHYSFADVPSTAYYADAINWAVAQSITNGTTETTFSPNNTCTTANIITFLWRADGSPEPKASNPFSDVQTGQYYAKAAVWAYEKGLVTGQTFDGNANCTRAATMKYLWILSGRPSSSSNPFTDVSNNADYAQAVAWAVAQGVTNGKTAATFAPDDTCTRGQIVTFLLRYYMR